jgi:hypothetical protein
MKNNRQYFLIILLLPSIAETIAASRFSISLPGSPFSLGRITFIIVGIVGIVNNRNFFLNSKTLRGLFFIVLGGMLGAFFSNQIGSSISRSIGTMLLLFGSIGIASLWQLNVFRKFLDLFFVLNMCYWVYYVFDLTILNGTTYVAYSQLFSDNEAINHHVAGVNVSVSTIYVAIRYFFDSEQLKFGGYTIVFIGIMSCFLCESRSNLMITVCVLFMIIFISKMKFYKLFFLVLPVCFIMYTTLIGLAENNETLFQRFDATDEDYQVRTTGMRFDFINGFFGEFLSNPFGKGVYGAEINYGYMQSTMLHNQYLTFILSGGVTALIGVVMWISEFITVFKYNVKKLNYDQYNFAIMFSMLAFILTMLTIEYSGLLFFVYVSLLINQSEIYVVERVSYFKRLLLRLNG